jgi:hypothetical protein
MVILHYKEESSRHSINFFELHDITVSNNYIDHHLKDRWTGLAYPSGRLVFERDRILINAPVIDDYGHPAKEEKNVCIQYSNELGMYRCDPGGWVFYNSIKFWFLTFLGIEGVKEAESEINNG